MYGTFLTELFSFFSPGVLTLHVKPEIKLKCQPQRRKMLLGTFKTVFISVFLVPTKTNTPHHMEGCSISKSGRGTEKRRRKQTFRGSRAFFLFT